VVLTFVVKERVAKAVCYDSYAKKRIRPVRVIKAGGVVAPVIYGASCKSGFTARSCKNE